MNRIYNIIFSAALLSTMIVSCSNDEVENVTAAGARELTGVVTEIMGTSFAPTTRTVTPSTRADDQTIYVGRETFKSADKIVMTKFSRTDNAISNFNYAGIVWDKNGDEGAWQRSADDGMGKIYWSDAKSDHTIIGYSAPQGNRTWKRQSEDNNVFTGQLSLTDGVVNYQSSDSKSGNEKIADDDILLTYSTTVKADNTGIASIAFRHALSCLMVNVNIYGFSVGDNDKKARVSDLVIKDQPYKYQWRQDADSVMIADNTTETAENTTETAESATEKADIKAWINNPEGTGNDKNRQFHFHSLAVPGTRETMVIEFKVSYPDPLNPNATRTNTYKATAKNIVLLAGRRTTLRVNLNHKDEDITIGASFDDWMFHDTPHEGELAKNSTYLSSVSRDLVTLYQQGLGKDDATWLYDAGEGKIRDIYDHEGTENDPYTIATAYQLLAFAYEVKGGRDFNGCHIRLDASLTMQPNTTDESIEWIGIGDDDHPFNGHFDGGLRHISRMKGLSFFSNIGSEAVVEGLVFDHMIVTSDGGSVAKTNAGKIVGCTVEGDVGRAGGESATAIVTESAGGICQTNSGDIIACAHIGNVMATTEARGIAGKNTGQIIGSYIVGDLVVTSTGSDPETGSQPETGLQPATEAQCYYNSDFYSSDTEQEKAKTTIAMIMSPFVEELNGEIIDSRISIAIQGYRFLYQPSEYPTLTTRVVAGSN